MITPLPTPEEMKPGTIYEFTNLEDIYRPFEDIVGEAVVPDMTVRQQRAWQGRPPLMKLLRPSTYPGSMARIALQVMENPYQQLTTARTDRNYKFHGGGGTYNRESPAGIASREQCLGFVLSAVAKSMSAVGAKREVQSELYYLPGLGAQRSTTPIVRLLTQPRLVEKKDFSELYYRP